MIRTRAPYRIFDCGGWTDTSFMPGGSGVCCNIAVALYVHVSYAPEKNDYLIIEHRASGKQEKIPLPFTGTPQTLAEAALAAFKLTPHFGGTILVSSDTPPGSGLGGSASYSVALLAAINPEIRDNRHGLASLAQQLETVWLNNSCGTQDQMAAAYGGVSYSEIHYPDFTHIPIKLNPDFLQLLEDRLVLVYTGESHFSSAKHQAVIDKLEKQDTQVEAAFYQLKSCAESARNALEGGDILAYQEIINANWLAQKALYPGMTTPAIESLHELLRSVDSNAGFKGCGAAGGGSVGILISPEAKQEFITLVRQNCPDMTVWGDLRIDTVGVSHDLPTHIL